MARSLRSRWSRRRVALLFGTLVSLAGLELGLRWLVLSDSALARAWGTRLRHAEWFASPDEEAFWKLACRFDHAVAQTASLPDPQLGWLKANLAPRTHELVGAGRLGERKPVLLYGDSFAQGMFSGPRSFEGLLRDSPLGGTHVLFNYGVGGYGADQILILARETLPLYDAQQPIAIVALLVDDDLDRCVLDFRSGPKPRFQLAHGRLVEPEPVETSVPRYLEQHPIGIASYVWRLLGFAPRILPARVQQALRGETTRLEEKRTLAEAILRETCRELRAHAPRAALMLMRARESVRDPQRAGWQEEWIRRVAAEEGLPVLDTREVLLHALGGRLEHLDNLYFTSGAGLGHWNAQGNRAVFQLLRAFVEGRPPESALAGVDELVARGELAAPDARSLEREALGGALFVQYREDSSALCFVQSPEASGNGKSWYLGLRAGNQGPSSMRWSLPAGTQHLRATLRAGESAGQAPGVRELVVHIRQPRAADPAAEQSFTLISSAPGQEWATDVAGGELEFLVEPPPGGGRSPWLLIDKARLE